MESLLRKRKGDSVRLERKSRLKNKNKEHPVFQSLILKPASLLAACFLCGLLFFYNQPEEKVFAYVSVDINPSLEASVTGLIFKAGFRACNDDGRRILKEMKRWEVLSICKMDMQHYKAKSRG